MEEEKEEEERERRAKTRNRGGVGRREQKEERTLKGHPITTTKRVSVSMPTLFPLHPQTVSGFPYQSMAECTPGG